MPIVQKLVLIGFLFLATLATGFWSRISGKPPTSLPLTLHKLTAFAAVIFVGSLIYHSARPTGSRAAFAGTIAVLGLSVVAVIASGALLTMPKLMSAIWLATHRIASAGAAIAFVLTVRLFILNR